MKNVHNMPPTFLKTGFDFIANSEQPFFLTGSRYFGTQRTNSDFDFVTKNTPEIVLALREYGFTRISYGRNTDSQLISVWEYGNVQIQLRPHICAFLRAQELINKLPANAKTDINSEMWKYAFLFANLDSEDEI